MAPDSVIYRYCPLYSMLARYLLTCEFVFSRWMDGCGCNPYLRSFEYLALVTPHACFLLCFFPFCLFCSCLFFLFLSFLCLPSPPPGCIINHPKFVTLAWNWYSHTKYHKYQHTTHIQTLLLNYYPTLHCVTFIVILELFLRDVSVRP